MSQQIALERQALEQIRRGDLRGARGTLAMLCQLRPKDPQIQRRLTQVEDLIQRRELAKQRVAAEPLRYAHAYIKAGRLKDGLKLLRAALSKDPTNARLRDLALQVARRLREDAEARASGGDGDTGRIAAEAHLRAQAQARIAKARAPSEPVLSKAPIPSERPVPFETPTPSGRPTPSEAPTTRATPIEPALPLSKLPTERPPPPPASALADDLAVQEHPPPRAAAAPRTIPSVPEPRGPRVELENLLSRITRRRRSPSRWVDAYAS